MTRAVLADTGPLYAANDEGDSHHQRALRELKKLARDKREVLIAYPTLLEAHSLLLFRLGRNAASAWLVDCRKVTITACYASKLVWRQAAQSPSPATNVANSAVSLNRVLCQRATSFAPGSF